MELQKEAPIARPPLEPGPGVASFCGPEEVVIPGRDLPEAVRVSTLNCLFRLGWVEPIRQGRKRLARCDVARKACVPSPPRLVRARVSGLRPRERPLVRRYVEKVPAHAYAEESLAELGHAEVGR